jgi:O-antigen/teichoic acid export membrane protein
VLSQIAILVYINHLYGLELSGLFSISIAITGPIFMFFNMQLKWLIATENNYYRFEEFLLVRILTSTIAVILGIVFFIFSSDIKFFYFFICVSSFKFFESISEIPYGFFQKKENFKLISLFSIFKASGIFFILLADFYFKLSFNIIFYITILYASSLFFEFFVINRKNKIVLNNIKNKLILNKIEKSWKYGIVSFLISLKTNIPRYFLSAIGLEKLAIFSTLNYLNYGSNFLFSSLGEVSNVKLSKSNKTPFNTIGSFVFMSFLYSLIFFMLFIIFENEIIFLLFGKRFSISLIFSISIFLSGFTSISVIIIQNYFMVYRFSKDLLIFNLVEILVLLIFFLINHFYFNLGMDNILFIPILISCFIAIASFKSLKNNYKNHLNEY